MRVTGSSRVASSSQARRWSRRCAAHAWKSQLVDYPHALVRLNFCKVFDWTGELQMHEGQQFRWERLPVQCSPVLPGTVPVLQWLQEEASSA